MSEPTFDPRRKAAIRDLIVTHAAANPSPARGRKRTALVTALVVLALAISGGSVAYALGTGLLDPRSVAAATPTPTPTSTSTPTPAPTPTPTTTVIPGQADAVRGCEQLAQMFMGRGSSEQDTMDTARAAGAQVTGAAESAQAADPSWAPLARTLTKAQASLLSYLDNDSPTTGIGIVAVEAAAADARQACTPLGVDVELQQ